MFLSTFEIFKIGIGPSSSHTMGPMTAAARFLADLRQETAAGSVPAGLAVSLHGSLAFTGKGHATDRAVILGFTGLTPDTLDPDAAEALEAKVRATGRLRPPGLPDLAFAPDHDLVFDYGPALTGHPNGLIFRAFDADGSAIFARTYYSIGGGFVVDAEARAAPPDMGLPADCPYPFRTAAEMLAMGRASGQTIAAMKRANEEAVGGPGLDDRLDRIRAAMDACIDRGLARDGILPGGLKVRRARPREAGP